MELEVILCTHNPRQDFLNRTLRALQRQTLSKETWGLIIIDNSSSEPVRNLVDLSWHPKVRVVREERLGLTHARLRGMGEAKTNLLVFSDDDTLLNPDYLVFAQRIFEELPLLGVAGGPSLPEYETCPEEWFHLNLAPLGCRDLGPSRLVASWNNDQQKSYPACAPIGAGMIIRREVMEAWANLATNDPIRQSLGRKGKSLSSGEDNDINLVALSQGWEIGYFPQLSLTHLLPSTRLRADYLERLAFASSRDWLRVLALHEIFPWARVSRWTVPLRKAKAWFKCRAWAGPAERIRWRGACGHFEGLSQLFEITSR